MGGRISLVALNVPARLQEVGTVEARKFEVRKFD